VQGSIWGVLKWEIAPLMEEVEYAVGVHVFEAGVCRVSIVPGCTEHVEDWSHSEDPEGWGRVVT
jgi:hypothetical protein